ncbi:MAG: hypothetical protein V3W20_10170 [Candidatus Neomarinimicrobiota bacterium]
MFKAEKVTLTEQLQLISMAGRALQLNMMVVLLSSYKVMQQLLQSLSSMVKIEFAVDKSGMFYVSPENNCLIDQNNQKVTGGSHKVFLSAHGQCIFLDKFNGCLQDPDGKPIDGASLKGQLFIAVTIKLNVPYELYPANEMRQQISNFMHTMFSNAPAKGQPAAATNENDKRPVPVPTP